MPALAALRRLQGGGYRRSNVPVTIGSWARSLRVVALRMKLARLILFVALNACVTVHASETFKIDPARSTIAFKVRHMLGTAQGKFSKFSGTIIVDREHPEQSSVVVRIQTASLDTGIAKRDEHLRESLFNVEKYPEITFKSRRVKQTGANSGQIVGDFTMHGITREITLNMQLVSNPETR